MRDHRGAILVGVLFLLLSGIYNLSIPLWESDNERSHFSYVRYIVDNRALPAPDSLIAAPVSTDPCAEVVETPTVGEWQFRQPPLYYLLSAGATFWVPVGDTWPVNSNPHVHTDPSRAGNNMVVHAANEAFPYRGTPLAVHIMRLVSGLFGLAGIVATYLTGLIFFADRRWATVAMAVNAFIPQYVFSSAVINNDILAGALGAWCVTFCASLVLRGWRWPVLALAVGSGVLALLAKYSSLSLVAAVGGVVLLGLVEVAAAQARRRGNRTPWLVAGLVGLVVVALGLWLMRVLLQQGALLADSYPNVDTVRVLVQALTGTGSAGQEVLNPLRAGWFAFMTFWGLFGNDNLALPPPVIAVYAAIALLALAGVVLFLLDKEAGQRRRWLVVAALVLIGLAWAVAAVKAAGSSEPRGRYLLPVYSTVSILLALGIGRLLPYRYRNAGLLALSGLMLALALALPVLLIRPAYAAPALAPSDELLPGEQPVYATFGDVAELIGYRIAPDRLGLFERLQVTLVWRSLGSTPSNYTVSLHLLDGANQSHGEVHAFPGRGNFATSLWQPGDVLRETYDLYLDSSARPYLPSAGKVKLTLSCFPGGDQYLEVRDAQGASVGDALTIGRFKLVAGESATGAAEPAPEPLLTFGEAITLHAFRVSPPSPRPNDLVTIELDLAALARPAADYTVFAHVVDEQGQVVAGYDLPLTNEVYPSSMWEPGDRVTHIHQLRPPLSLPPEGTYQIRVGLYEPGSGTRLATRQPDGTALPGDSLVAVTFPGAQHLHYVPSVERSDVAPEPLP